MDLPTRRFHEYLRVVYGRMAEHVPEEARVVEIGTRIWRGVITPECIPCTAFVAIDRDPRRPGLTVDALEQPIHADVILSTCVLHHTDEADVPRLLGNLRAPLLMFSGPNAATHEPYGDHHWHLEESKLRTWLGALGYEMAWQRIGLTQPFCEALVIATRTA